MLVYRVRKGLCEAVWGWPLDVVVVSVVYHLGLYVGVWIPLECAVSALECDRGQVQCTGMRAVVCALRGALSSSSS